MMIMMLMLTTTTPDVSDISTSPPPNYGANPSFKMAAMHLLKKMFT